MLNFNLNEKEILIMMRRNKGIKQQEIADAVGVYQPQLSDFERGKKELSEERYKVYKNFIINYEEYSQIL